MSKIRGENQVDFTNAPLAGADATGLDLTGAVNVPAGSPFQNNFTATTNPTANDDASAGYSIGSQWINTSTGDLFTCIDATAGSAVWVKTGSQSSSSIQNNLNATTNPTATDDSSQGYSVGSMWVNTTNDEIYVLVDDTAGSAKWVLTGGVDANASLTTVSKTVTNSAPTVNDDSSNGYSVGDTWTDTTTGNIYTLVDDTVGAAVWVLSGNTNDKGTSVPLSNKNATGAPTANDDSTKGYSVGSTWVDTSSGKVYTLVDDTAGAAVWKEITPSSTGGGGATYTNNYTELFAGVSPQAGSSTYFNGINFMDSDILPTRMSVNRVGVLRSNTDFEDRDVSLDIGGSPTIFDKAIVGGYLYVVGRSGSSFFCIRYDVNNLSAGGTAMTFVGQVPTNINARMVTNGTRWYLVSALSGSYSNVWSEYSLAGTTFTYIGDITLTDGATSSQFYAAVSGTKIYLSSSANNKIINTYDFTGGAPVSSIYTPYVIGYVGNPSASINYKNTMLHLKGNLSGTSPLFSIPIS